MSLLGDIKDVGAAVFEVGKAAKGLIGNADKLAGGVKGLGSLFQRFSTVGRLAELARLGRKLSEYGDDALRFLANPEIKKFLKRAKTPILFGGQMTISGMKLTTGVGGPDDGARFGAGASRFAGARDTLAGAYPNGSWAGSGSESYSNSNSRQIGRAQTMVASDQAINAVLAREAGQITATRAVLDDQSDWLADVGLVTMLVAATPFVGQGAALAMEIAAVTKALGACAMQLTELTQQVNSNAAEISQTAGRYGERPGRSGRSNMSKKTPDPNTPPQPPPSGEKGDAPGDGDTGDGDTDSSSGESGSDRTQAEGTGTGGGSGSGSGGGSSSGGTPSGDRESADMPSAPEPIDASTPTSPFATGSPASGGGAAPGSLAAPLSSLPGAAVGAMPAAAAGMSAAQIASLVQSAVQKAMQEQAAKEAEKEAEHAKDTDGDGIPDVDEDENGDGIPDVEQNLEQQDADGEGPPEESGAAAGAPDGGRAPVHLAVDVDPARMASPITATLDRNDPIGSPSLAQQ